MASVTWEVARSGARVLGACFRAVIIPFAAGSFGCASSPPPEAAAAARPAPASTLSSVGTDPRGMEALGPMPAAVPPPPGGPFAPRWTAALPVDDLTSLDAIRAALDEPLHPNGEALSLQRTTSTGDTERVAITSCRQYRAARADGFSAGNTFELSQESFFKARCVPLEFLARARPANQSYVSTLRLDNSPLALLPAAMNFDIASPTDEQIALIASGARLDTYSPELVVKTSSEISLELEEPLAQYMDSIDLVAWGDYDHDGLEDVLFFQSTHALQGSYRGYWHVVATRKGPREPLTVLATMR